jgi:hypothetical protein
MFISGSHKHFPHPLATSRRVIGKRAERFQGERDFSIEAYQRLDAGRHSALGASNTVGGLKRIVLLLVRQLLAAVLKSWREQASLILSYCGSSVGLERHAIIAHYSTLGWCDSTERDLNNELIGRSGWLQSPPSQLHMTVENKLP